MTYSSSTQIVIASSLDSFRLQMATYGNADVTTTLEKKDLSSHDWDIAISIMAIYVGNSEGDLRQDNPDIGMAIGYGRAAWDDTSA